NDVSGVRVVLKIRAVNLVEAVRLVAIDDDVYIMQLGPATFFELLCLGGVNGEKRPAAFGLGKRESFGALGDLGGNLPESGPQFTLCLEQSPQVEGCHNQDNQHRSPGKKPAEDFRIERHLSLLYPFN